MISSLSELKGKEVVNVKDGEKLGYIDDIEFESESGQIIAFVIFGRRRIYGLLGKENDIIIGCKQIELIGRDTVLVALESADSDKCTKSKAFSINNLYKNFK